MRNHELAAPLEQEEAIVRVGILGPLQVHAGDRELPLGGPKPRAILAMLVLEANRVVSRDRLADGLWGDRVPATADKTIQVYVSRLRHMIGPSRLVTVGRNYRLDLAPGSIDAGRFLALVTEARLARRHGRTDAAASVLRRALDLWRGMPLADFVDAPFARPEIARLEDARLDAIEERTDAELELGDSAAVVGELEALVAANPLRERLRGLLMLALYRTQRQADALAVYGQTVERLREDLGLVPGAELRRLHQSIVIHDPALSAVSGSPPARLAAPLESLIGRDGELKELLGMLADPAIRLLTVTGAGGAGKTSLTVEAIRRAPPGHLGDVVMVHLAGLTEPDQVLPELARTLRVGVSEGEALSLALRRAMRARHLTLVLDNFEHVVGAADPLKELLEQCPSCVALVTSRVPLGIPGEHVLRIGGLAHPARDRTTEVDALARYPAVRLLVRLARIRDPTFVLSSENADAVASLCASLGGLPLAIELAAALAGVLSPGEILDRLGQLLDIESRSGAVPDRQRTLRATLDWSLGLLSGNDRLLYARLSVFAGGFTLDGAQAVAGDEDLRREEIVNGLARLVDHGLIRTHPSVEGRRLAMLEPVRQHSARLLASADCELHPTHARHSTHTTRLAHAAGEALLQPRQLAWLARLDDERADLLAVARRRGSPHDAETALAALGPLDIYWTRRGLSPEVITLLRDALSAPVGDRRVRARALLTFGWLTYDSGDVAAAIAALTECLELCVLEQDARMEMWVRAHLALTHSVVGRPSAATAFRQEALLMAANGPDDLRRALVLFYCGLSFTDYTSTRSMLNESLARLRSLGDELYVGSVSNALGAFALLADDRSQARESLGIAVREAEKFPGGNLQALALGNRGLLGLLDGRNGPARGDLTEALRITTRCGNRAVTRECLNGLAAVELNEGQRSNAERLAASAEALYDAPRSPHDELIRAHFLANLSQSVLAGQSILTGESLGAAEIERVIADVLEAGGEH